MCKSLHMATNLAIDDALLKKALKIGGKKTKKDTVNEALKEFIVRREQQKVLGLFGTVDYFEDYEPKKFRSK
jgi:Arc/MetJ family transcription regulator